MPKLSVLFVCVHNSGRSQMAAGFLKHLAGDRVEVLSAGSEPADQVNPVAAEAMAEKGIDLTRARPKGLTEIALGDAPGVITMGCGDSCPVYPGKRYEKLGARRPGRSRPGTGAPDPRCKSKSVRS